VTVKEEATPPGPPPTLTPVAKRAPRPVPRIRVALAVILSAFAGVLVALSEVDGVLSQVVSGGKSWSPNQLSSIGTVFHPGDAGDGWRFFHVDAPGIAPSADTWLGWYVGIDVLFALGYLVLAYRAAMRTDRPLRFFGAMALVAGGGADITEDFLALTGTHPYVLIGIVTIVKWFFVVLGGLLLLVSVRGRVGPMPGHVLRALYTHRYTVVVVLPLAVLGLARGTDILEQVPDIQRTWLDERLWDLPAAGLVLTIVGVSMLYVGRQRTSHLWVRTCDDWTDGDHPDDSDHPGGVCKAKERQRHGTDPLLHVWLVGPAVLLVLALLTLALGGPVSWGPLIIFCVVPLAVAWGSWRLRKRKGGRPERPIRRPVSIQQYDVTAVVGDILVGTLMLVAGLASIRAFAAPALVDPHFGNFVMLVIGAAAILGGWPLHAWLLRLLAKRTDKLARRATDKSVGLTWRERSLSALTPGVEVVAVDAEAVPVTRDGFWDTLKDQRWNWAVLTGSLVLLLAVASAPLAVARLLGVIGTFELALGCLSVLVAATVILLQKGGAPEAFWLVGIPYAPVTTLLIVSALVAGTRSDGVHDIRDYAGEHGDVTAANRPTLDGLFQQWLADGASCAKTTADPTLKVRPMLLYAAEGGGIRAAYWTTKAVDRIGAPRQLDGHDVDAICRSAFLSSGASGGSVGLTIASVSGIGDATHEVKEISGPQALARATDGLVLRDTLYAATGVPLPSLGGPSQPDWADRGTLIEQSWQDSIEGFENPFLVAASDWTWTPPGALVINSTATTTACRTLVSQIQVTSSPGRCTTGAEDPQPGAVSAANSTDLMACTGQLRSVTAALLTARFPYVTPSGVIDCDKDTRLQIVDGGYAENFGLGTLVDLAPQLMDLVRTHNGCVLRLAAPGTDDPLPANDPCIGAAQSDTLVVPMVVYLDNGSGTDLAQQPGGLDLEVLVPPVTLLEAKKELYEARSQLARAAQLFDTDQLWDAGLPRAAVAADVVTSFRKSPVAIVFQATRPQVAAPLGWVLSEASMRSMDNSICDLEHGQDIGEALNPAKKKETDPLLEHSLDDVMSMLPGTLTEKCERPKG
jgi:hypothetical protein